MKKWNSNQKWNKELYQCECKNWIKYHVCEKDYICNTSTCACEFDKYLNNIIGDLVVTCDEIIDVVAKPYDRPTNFKEKRKPVK